MLRIWVTLLILCTMLTSCAIPRVAAQDRVFLPLSLEFVDEYQLAKQTFQDTTVGGLSGITYDRSRGLFYAISDDRFSSPARFYTLKLALSDEAGTPRIQDVTVENVTFLKDSEGNTYPKGSVDAEAIALSPKDTVFVANEANPPFISEFDLKTGQLQQSLPIPERFIPNEEGKGMRPNLGFESLTLNPTGTAGGKGDPFRLFTATESAIAQDINPETSDKTRVRFLHYLINDVTAPLVISSHLYPLDVPPETAIDNGLTDIVSVDTGGHFLALERSYGAAGGGAKIFQIATGGANDISTIPTLKGELRGIQFIKKKLLLDLSDLGIKLDNLEAIALGSRLADGSRSLIVVSDDNFNDAQITQFLLFRVKGLT